MSPITFQTIGINHKLEKVLSKQLQKAGCTVHVANHGQEALDFLQRSYLWRDLPGGVAVDVVLMDLEMPVMDGLTCARRIRELQGQGNLIRHVPLIAVTANARKEQIETSLAAGMVSCLPDLRRQKSVAVKLADLTRGQDDVMPKPFRVSELLTKMEALKRPEWNEIKVRF